MFPPACIVAVALLLPGWLQQPIAGDPPAPRGVVRHAPGAFDGYTLIAPMLSHDTLLIDMDGQVVHRWHSELTPGESAYLLEDGSLLRCGRVLDNPTFSGSAGPGGRIQRISWDGELVWDYLFSDATRLQHHDIEPLPNGNVLLLAWERRDADEALTAGREPGRLECGEIWTTLVVEVQPVPPNDGQIVWEWRAWDHLVQDRDPGLDGYGSISGLPRRIDINGDAVSGAPPPIPTDGEVERLRAIGYVSGSDSPGLRHADKQFADWDHVNSIDYSAGLDQVVLSAHNFSELWVIDHSTTTEEARGSSGGRQGHGGDLLFRWGNPREYGRGAEADRRLFAQHDAQWIAPDCPGAGNLLVFDNGRGRPSGNRSAVVELRPDQAGDGSYLLPEGAAFGPKEPHWSWSGEPEQPFYSSILSGAQRLPNGNTLACLGRDSCLLEVAPDGRVVWEFRSPFGGETSGPDRRALDAGTPTARAGPDCLFRATRLPRDHPGLKRLLVN